MSTCTASPTFLHKVSKESLWMDACFPQERTPQGLALSSGTFKVSQHEAAAFVALLRMCAKTKDLYRGTLLHDDVLKRGLLDECSDALVTMYAKCGALRQAKAILDMHKSMDVITWTSLIAGYARAGQAQNALDCFQCMQREGIPPNAVTYSCILKACGIMGDPERGKQIHDEIARQGLLQNNVVLGTALVNMYAKCGLLSKAQCVLEELPFRDVVCWSALIAGFAQDGQAEQALSCFECMQHEGIPPNAVTYACVLKACGNIGAADKGTQIHNEIVRQGLLQNDIVLGTALVDMYVKCRALLKAQHVLEELSSRDVASWNALIAGYAQEGQGEQALSCFERMQQEGIPPDAVTYACMLKACGTVGDIDKGKQIHDEIGRHGLLQNNVVLGTALVDMYAKCGALSKAQHVFEGLPSRDVTSWSTLIAGYAQEGQDEQALRCFESMQREGIPPDAVTFVCVLNVCSHLGLVEEGHLFFLHMSTKYGVKPNLECYACMVGLFGRAGHLERAVQLIQEMPSSDYSPIWLALLGACWKWGDVNVGRWAFEQAIKVDKTDASVYVLMANIYAAAGMNENAKEIEALRTKMEEAST